MDRYDFNIKVEKLKELAKAKDYENAMKIADAIDWRRVQDIKLLQLVSEVYENNGEYGEAKEILLLAYERSGLGRRFLYKLVELAIKEGSLKEAESYCKEFEEIAQGDSRVYILRYLLLSAKGEDITKRIEALQEFNARELDEKYMYELAKLYYEANMKDESLLICDNIILMFGIGDYVEKAMRLKSEKLGISLNSYQQSLIDHKEQYEDKLRAVEEEFANQEEDIDKIEENLYSREKNIDKIDFVLPSKEEAEQMKEIDEEIARHIEEIEEPEKSKEEGYLVYNQEEISVEEVLEEELSEDNIESKEEPNTETEENLYEESKEDLNEEILAEESKEEEINTKNTSEALTETHKVEIEVENNTEEGFLDIAEDIKQIEKSLKKEEADSASELPKDRIIYIVENEANINFEKLISELKEKNEEIKNRQLIKIEAKKLNSKDFLQVLPKLEGKALLVEEAGDLDKDKFELIQLASLNKDIKFIFVDNSLQLDTLRDKDIQEYSREKAVLESTSVKESVQQVEEKAPEDTKERYIREELSIDDFATYASDYAKEIDCYIPGKSMLVLYERIELMQDEHIPLTRKTAEDMITRAADRAERPSFFRSIRAMLAFERKYDKDGKLILKEEHFAV